MRSCDSVGIKEIFVLFTETHLDERRFKLGKRTSAGTRKWLDVHLYRDPQACFEHVKSKYQRILSTHLSEDAVGLHQLDLAAPVALLFGNEHDGLSEAALAHSDGNFIIPQMGMAESLNISVACAVTLYEAFRQRRERDLYTKHPQWPAERQAALLQEYLRRHGDRFKNQYPTEAEEGEG